MTDFSKNCSSWEKPGTIQTYSKLPLEPGEKIALFIKGALITLAEICNWAFHTTSYAMVNTVGSDVFLIDALGLPELALLNDLTLSFLINGLLGLAAVATPVFLFSQLLQRHEEIFSDPKTFFKNGLNTCVTALLVLLYLLVIASEFSALYMRVLEENTPSLFASAESADTSFWPMLLMSIALIVTNAAIGLACAHIYRSISSALGGK